MVKAYFGGGCFWCTEAVFSRLKGVTAVTSGYAGGTSSNPNYFKVSEELTGHAEVIAVEFEPEIISYAQLLDVFFHTHNPTTLNQQGHDIGPEYRSLILVADETQRAAAEQARHQYQADFTDPIVTEIKPFEHFYPAEEYHQRYYERNQNERYCELVIDPKLDAFRARYKDLLKDKNDN